ncbi:MAG: M16 family metallopeptidase [Candidatus Methylomirabilia bacterium]
MVLALSCVLVAVFALAGCAAGPVATDPRTMRFPTLPLAPPQPKRVVLENGLVLFLLRDPEVPLVTVQALVRTGAVLEPADKVDLAEIAGRVMRTGGTARHTGQQLNERLESLGAGLETGIGRQAGTASLSVLAPDLAVGIELLAEVLRAPVFDPAEVERVKRRKIEEIRRSNDEPDAVAFREFRAAVYGDDPRGRQSTPEMVAALTREDLVEFHARSFFPDRTMLGISGLFEEEQLLALLRRHFGDWRPAGTPAPVFPVPGRPPQAGVFLAAKEVPQATLIMGHLAPPKDSADYFAFSVLDYILGGSGFGSRLTSQIRSDRGLAYSVGSFYRGDVGYGVFGAYCMTKSTSALEAARLMRGIIGRIGAAGVNAAELRRAKDAIVNNLIFSVDGTREVVAQRMGFAYDGFPDDFLERYRDRVEAVSLEDVRAVAVRCLHPEALSLVAVGEEAALKGFEEFGPVTRIPLRKY